mmetsp:Transcript_14057/g.21903  ORF Transcript_14057/g.21903 Transcript_14057/m.21903 type:complete len:112 (+) Transcript_14057:2108-2443(+)
MFAEYFAARFFLASIATNLYLLKDSKKNVLFRSFKEGLKNMLGFSKPERAQTEDERDLEFENQMDDVGKHFQTINITPLNLIFDPLFKWCVRPCWRRCRRKQFVNREKVLA